MSATLSKKQQKAAAFRTKQKAKKRGVEAPEDVPEADLDDGDGEEGAGADEGVIAPKSKSAKGKEKEKDAGKESGKKRKRGDDEDGDEGAEAEAEAEGETKKSKKDIKQRYILFIGNLGFKTKRDEVAKHFAEAAGRTPSVRLLTEKAAPGSKTPPKSRGIAFLELSTGSEMQACLRLHHTILNNRQINVELTAGGGGKSAVRRDKIAERNSRVGTQREKRAEKEAEEAAKNPPSEPVAGEGAQGWKVKEVEDAPEGFKMRNGRRVKAKTGADGQSAWAARNGGGGRKKWEPTGANALAVSK